MSEEQNQQTTQEEVKPVYKASTGIPSVDDYREAESNNFQSEGEPLVEPQNVQNENTTEVSTPLEENASSFSMPSLDGEVEGEANCRNCQLERRVKKSKPERYFKRIRI